MRRYVVTRAETTLGFSSSCSGRGCKTVRYHLPEQCWETLSRRDGNIPDVSAERGSIFRRKARHRYLAETFATHCAPMELRSRVEMAPLRKSVSQLSTKEKSGRKFSPPDLELKAWALRCGSWPCRASRDSVGDTPRPGRTSRPEQSPWQQAAGTFCWHRGQLWLSWRLLPVRVNA